MNRNNPTIEELTSGQRFELIAQLEHNEIKSFIINQLSKGGRLVKGYMLYQLMMIILGIFVLTRSLIYAFNGIYQPLWYCIGAVVICLSALIILHELIHGIAIKITGANKVNYGAYLRKFIFFAEADRHVMNRKQFTFIALAPLVFVKIATLVGILFFFSHPLVYAFTITMCIHSLFCAGDIGLLSVFYSTQSEVFTFDVKEERKSYYFREKLTDL